MYLLLICLMFGIIVDIAKAFKTFIKCNIVSTVVFFKESTEWFAGLPNIKKDGIGIIGLSKGGMYALELCRQVPQVCERL